MECTHEIPESASISLVDIQHPGFPTVAQLKDNRAQQTSWEPLPDMLGPGRNTSVFPLGLSSSVPVNSVFLLFGLEAMFHLTLSCPVACRLHYHMN